MINAIKEISGILEEAPKCFIASIDGSEPRVRAFQYQFEQEGKLWFCMAKNKDVCKQLQDNQHVEICAVTQDKTRISITAKMTFDDSKSIKERILAERPLFKSIYKTADNMDLTAFCLEHGVYSITDFSGRPPRSGSF